MRSVRSRSPCSTWPPGIWTFWRLQRPHHVGRREPRPASFAVSTHHVDLARPAADDAHLADAADRLDLAPQRLVRELGDVADGSRPGERDGEDRRGVGVDLLDDRRIGVARQLAQDAC